jgi:hypothetical protein
MITAAYDWLAREYDDILGDLAEATWRSGILAELARLGAGLALPPPHHGGYRLGCWNGGRRPADR